MSSTTKDWPRARGSLLGVLVPVLAAAGLIVAAISQAHTGPQPTITGSPIVGETLTSSSAGDTALYRWQSCDPAASGCGAGDGDGTAEGWSFLPGADQQSYTVAESDLGRMLRVRAKGTSLGEQFVSSDPVGPVTAAEEPLPPPPVGKIQPKAIRPAATPLEPDHGQTLLIDDAGGTVLIKVPGDSTYGPVTELREIPIGSIVDATQGTAKITAQNGDGADEQASFWGGTFQALQGPGATSYFEARLGTPPTRRSGARVSSRLATASSLAHTAAAKPKLWGSGSGKFRTRGKGGAATLVGTTWLTQEKGDGTLFKVTEGHGVDVKDFGRRGLISLTPGEQYFAH
jgi:hypothetical protein